MNHRGEVLQGEGAVLGPAFQRFPAVGAAVPNFVKRRMYSMSTISGARK